MAPAPVFEAVPVEDIRAWCNEVLEIIRGSRDAGPEGPLMRVRQLVHELRADVSEVS